MKCKSEERVAACRRQIAEHLVQQLLWKSCRGEDGRRFALALISLMDRRLSRTGSRPFSHRVASRLFGSGRAASAEVPCGLGAGKPRRGTRAAPSTITQILFNGGKALRRLGCAVRCVRPSPARDTGTDGRTVGQCLFPVEDLFVAPR